MDPLVSIVISNYNYARYVRQAIESALAQTHANKELIIVDDGSTDESPNIISAYVDRAHVIFKDNGGQASAFNVGIMQAKGDYILLLDSDDYLFPNAVETCLRLFSKGYSRVYYRLKVVDADGKTLPGVNPEEIFKNFDGDVFEAFIAGKGIFWAPTSANFFDARKLKSILPVPEVEYRICADAFVAVWSALTGPIRSIDEELGAYRVHGDNHFFAKSRFLSDKKILRNRIDDYFRRPALLEQACKKAGFDYRKPVTHENFALLEMLCAGHKLSVESPYLERLSKNHLMSRIWRYLRFANDPVSTRVRRAIYCSLVLFAPPAFAKPLLRVKDLWSLR